ncbi:hypothetical protein MFRU_030g00850 [Monilinia fructicola]|nr:hypothetical protein MFRU_030g00850 [Monilinia fructicola]
MPPTQQILTTLQSSPYYTHLQTLQSTHQTTTQALLAQIHNHISLYREAVRAGDAARVQECQGDIDARVREVAEGYERRRREWDVLVERLAEDIGGRVGRVLLEVRGETNGEYEMELKGVVDGVARRMGG